MKNKSIILFSILTSVIMVACNNQLPNDTSNTINPMPSESGVVPTQSSSPEPVNTSVTLPPKLGIIKVFAENNSPANNIDYLFSDISIDNNTIAINNNKFYSSNGDVFFPFMFSLDNFEPILYDSSCGSVGDNPWPRPVVVSISPFCNYQRSKFKKGKSGDTFIIGYNLGGRINNIGKLQGDDISQIYSYSTMSTNYSLISEAAFDKSSNIYLTFKERNSGPFREQNNIKKINSNGIEEWSRTKDNTTGEDFFLPKYIEVDKNNNLYFFDVQDFKIKKMTPDGVVSTIIGGGDQTSLNITGINYKISGTEIKLAMDNNDNLYIIEKLNNRVLKYDLQSSIISNFIGTSEVSTSDINSLNSPLSMTFDNDNNAYIIDLDNKAVKKIDAKTGSVSFAFGSLNYGYETDLSKVSFRGIYSIYSKNNNLYVGESDRIRKIDSNGVTTTIAGNGDSPTIAGNGQSPTVFPSSSPLFSEGSLPADKSIVFIPEILYINKNDDIYFSERGWIRKMISNRIESIPSNFATSSSVTEDSKGNSYFSSHNIKKLDKNNNIEIFAGQPLQHESLGLPPPSVPSSPEPNSPYNKRGPLQDGTKAKDIYMLNPSSMVTDSKDNIYAIVQYTYDIDERYSYKTSIIKISPDGIIKNVAGNSSDLSYLEDLLTSDDPTIPIKPGKLIIDKADNLYFLDYINGYNQPYNVIRKIDAQTGKISVYAGTKPSNNKTEITSIANNTNAKDVVLSINSPHLVTVDENGFVYFVGNGGKIYKIE